MGKIEESKEETMQKRKTKIFQFQHRTLSLQSKMTKSNLNSTWIDIDDIGIDIFIDIQINIGCLECPAIYLCVYKTY